MYRHLNRIARRTLSRHGRITLRAVLLLVLALGTIALFLDVRARRLSNRANMTLRELNLSELPEPAEIHAIINRNPTSTREVSGGLIEEYKYRRGVPWLFCALRVGYAEDGDQHMRYLDHNLNERKGEFQLEQVIAAHWRRLLHPPRGEDEYVEGPAELGIDDVYKGVQRGVRLVLAYDAEAHTFKGSAENAIRDPLKRVRVTVTLSSGNVLGPTILGDMESGSQLPVELRTDNTNFHGWTAYLEHDLYPSDSYRAVQHGAEVTLAYDSEMKAFKGRVRNTTTETIDEIHIAVRLSDGTELGPVMFDSVPPEAELDVELTAEGEAFTGWSVQTTAQ